MASIEAVSGNELSIRGSIDTDVVRVRVVAIDRTCLFIIQGDGQSVRCSTLRIQGDLILFRGMHILTGLTDADVGLHHHKAILPGKGVHGTAITMLDEPGFGKGICKIYFQVTRLHILDSRLHDGE